MDEPITTAEAAEELKISTSLVARMARRGYLVPLLKLPGHTGAYLFDAQDVENYRKNREATA